MQQRTVPQEQRLVLSSLPEHSSALSALLRLFSEAGSRKEYLDGVVQLVHEWSGCRCVGIRVLDAEGNIPFESYLGFSHELWASENWLSVKDDNCICIRIINGTPEPQDAPAITPSGSFACGNTFDFVAGLSAEAQARFRGVCIQAGFASVTVVPISHLGRILGAIHLADEREDRIAAPMVEFVEAIAPMVEEAVRRFGLEEELHRDHDFLTLLNTILRLTVDGSSLEEVLRRAQEALSSMPWLTFEPRAYITLVEGDSQPQGSASGYLQVPIRSGDRVLGAIGMRIKEDVRSRQREEAMVESVADVLAGIIVRERAQRALAESEAQFRRLAENAQDMIYRYEVRPRRGFRYVSPACTRLLGHTPEELYADADLVTKLAFHDDLPALRDLLQGRLDPQPLVSRWQAKDGRIVWTEQRTVLIRDDEAGTLVIEGIMRDITEREQMEEQLLRAERLEMAGKVAGQVAHDLNNLLSPLVGYPQLIKRHLPPDHPVVQYCDAQLRVARQMVAINEDLLTLGRRGRLKMQPVEVNYIVGIALEEIQPMPEALRLQVELAPALPKITGEPSQLLRVITNLLSNAMEAMEDNGVLTVRTENVGLPSPAGRYHQIPPGEYVRVAVSDTGPGIPADILDRIFDPFFSTKQTGKKSGAGLGLSVVHAIMDDHGGRIDLTSRLGEGTTFEIYLPIPQAP